MESPSLSTILIIGILILITGAYVYKKPVPRHSSSRATRLYSALLRTVAELPRKYFLVTLVLGWTLISIFCGNVSFSGFEIKVEYLILSYMVLSVALRLDSRISIGSALVLLMACPFLLMFYYEALAENAAVYAYYFLVIGVVLQIKDWIIESGRFKRETTKKTTKKVDHKDRNTYVGDEVKYRVIEF